MIVVVTDDGMDSLAESDHAVWPIDKALDATVTAGTNHHRDRESEPAALQCVGIRAGCSA